MSISNQELFRKIDEFIQQHQDEDCQIFFQIDQPEWDTQKLNYSIHIVAEFDFGDASFTITDLLDKDQLKEKVLFLKKKYDLKFYHWEMRRFEYFTID